MRGPSGRRRRRRRSSRPGPRGRPPPNGARSSRCSLAASTALSGDGVSRGGDRRDLRRDAAGACLLDQSVDGVNAEASDTANSRWKRRTMSFASLRCTTPTTTPRARRGAGLRRMRPAAARQRERALEVLRELHAWTAKCWWAGSSSCPPGRNNSWESRRTGADVVVPRQDTSGRT